MDESIQVVAGKKYDKYVIVNYMQLQPYTDEGFAVMPNGYTVGKERMCSEVVKAIEDENHDFLSLGVYKLVKVDPYDIVDMIGEYLESEDGENDAYNLADYNINVGGDRIIEPSDNDIEREVSKIVDKMWGFANHVDS